MWIDYKYMHGILKYSEICLISVFYSEMEKNMKTLCFIDVIRNLFLMK